MNGHLFEVERLVQHRQDTIARDVARAQGLDTGGRPTLRERLAMIVMRHGKGAVTGVAGRRAALPLESGAGD